MNVQSVFPTRLHWDADALAAAVPLRLFELFAFDEPSYSVPACGAARGVAASAAPRPWHGAYHALSPLPALVRVHN